MSKACRISTQVIWKNVPKLGNLKKIESIRASALVRMDIGSIRLKGLTLEEHDQLPKEVRCVRCCEKCIGLVSVQKG